MPLREFKRKYVMPNDWVSMVLANRHVQWMGL